MCVTPCQVINSRAIYEVINDRFISEAQYNNNRFVIVTQYSYTYNSTLNH